jgi:hypothetical protein
MAEELVSVGQELVDITVPTRFVGARKRIEAISEGRYFGRR